jgi:hypothetical protein
LLLLALNPVFNFHDVELQGLFLITTVICKFLLLTTNVICTYPVFNFPGIELQGLRCSGLAVQGREEEEEEKEKEEDDDHEEEDEKEERAIASSV